MECLALMDQRYSCHCSLINHKPQPLKIRRNCFTLKSILEKFRLCLYQYDQLIFGEFIFGSCWLFLLFIESYQTLWRQIFSYGTAFYLRLTYILCIFCKTNLILVWKRSLNHIFWCMLCECSHLTCICCL